MSKITSYIATEKSSEKSFGLVFSIVFLIFALYPLTSSESIHYWALAISAVFLLFAFLAPKILILPNLKCYTIGQK